MAKEVVKEPLFHIAKRDAIPWWKAWIIRICAVFGALVLTSIISIALTGKDPIKIFGSIIKGSFSTATKRWLLLREVSILLAISVAVTPAFKMKFWNIGAEGQVLVGCLASGCCIMYLGDSVSSGVLLVLMTISAILAGMLWAVIPAIFKAKFNTNETLFTLMMNYIATFLTLFFIDIWVPSGSGTLGILKNGQFPLLGGNEYILPILIVLAITVFMFVYLKYSKQGYEISVVGESVNTARYAGMNVGKIIIRTLLVSGAICGITGLLLVGAINHTVTDSLVGGQGFTAIMVSWLAKFNPLYMILTAFLVIFFKRGASQLSTDFSGAITADFGEIIVGIIFFFIIGCEFFISYVVKVRKKKKVEPKDDFIDKIENTEEKEDN